MAAEPLRDSEFLPVTLTVRRVGGSLSSYVANRTLPDRAAVRTRNSNARLTAGFARFGERDERSGTESEFAAPTAVDEPLDPASGSGRLNEEIPAVPVKAVCRTRPDIKATIARIQKQIPVFIGVSVRTRRVRPRFHPRATAAPSRGPSWSPGGVRAGRVTPECPPLRHQPPSRYCQVEATSGRVSR